MDAQQWLNQVQAALARQNLPPFYVERLTAELSDHITDSLEDRMSTDAKDLRHFTSPLGTPAAVAAAAIGEFRKRRFSSRHPIVVFVMLPLVALVLMWAAEIVAIALSAAAISRLFGGTGSAEQIPDWLAPLMPVLAGTTILAPLGLAAMVFCHIAGRAAITWKWPLAACVLMAVVGGAAFFDVKVANVDRGVLHDTRFHEANNPAAPLPRGSMAFGFGVSAHPRPWQIVQFSVPLAICGLFAWRQYSHRRQHVLAG